MQSSQSESMETVDSNSSQDEPSTTFYTTPAVKLSYKNTLTFDNDFSEVQAVNIYLHEETESNADCSLILSCNAKDITDKSVDFDEQNIIKSESPNGLAII